MKDAIKYREKYIDSFNDVFEVPYESLVKEKIDKVLIDFIKDKIDNDVARKHLKEITQDFEFTPFKWILHHIKIDETNTQFFNRHKNNLDVVVYKYFEIQDYGFNLFSDLYEVEHKRISYVERRAKLFRLFTLLNNENAEVEEFLPKITTTFFKDHKYNYGIFDWGVLTIYTKGEIWDNKLKRYVISNPKSKTVSKSYSFSFSKGDEKYKTIKNQDGSSTTIDNLGNSETHFINGCIETRLKNGTMILEYPDGAIKKQTEKGQVIELDFEGKPVTKKIKTNFWNKYFKK
jgi:hypothetical protein